VLPIRTILIGTDFSPYSKDAFALASSLASDCKARLLIAHVRELPVPPAGEFGVLPLEGEKPEDGKAQLFALKPADPTVQVEYFLLEGMPPADALLQLAEQQGCDLVVLGSHGHTGLLRLLMGSVTERVVRNARCPVLVVKHPQAERARKTKGQAQSAKS
jgi:nucleotide-binding universal stress UspA family protein